MPRNAAREAVALPDRYLDYREGVRGLVEKKAEHREHVEVLTR